LIRLTRRQILAGLTAGAAEPLTRRACATQQEMRTFRGLYRPPGFPRLANDPLTALLADAWHLDGSAYNPNQGSFGAPLWGFSLRGYPYRTQFAAFSASITAAGQGCRFDGASQYICTSVGAAGGPWATTPTMQTLLVVAQVDAARSAPQTLIGIEAHNIGRRLSLQIAANSANFSLNWATNNTTSGSFAQSVLFGAPFAAIVTVNYNTGAATLFFDHAKSTITGPVKIANQWDEANFGNSVIGSSVQNNYLNGVVLFGAAWNTILPDRQIFDLLDAPFSFLVFPDDEMMVEIAGAAAAKSLGAHGFPR
jgi:hypothetical protein